MIVNLSIMFEKTEKADRVFAFQKFKRVIIMYLYFFDIHMSWRISK